MRSPSLALAVCGALLSCVNAAAVVGVGLPCVLGTPDVCLNANVLTLADASANVVLTCLNGTYTSYLCATGKGCQGGTCVTLLASPNTSNTGIGITITTTNPSATTTVAATTTPIVGVGVPCVVGVDLNVCLNANVLTLADANANVILECVNGVYTAVLCPSGQGCQKGACVTLLGEPNSGTNTGGAATTSTSGSASSTSQTTSSPVAGTNDATGRGASSTDPGMLPTSRYPPYISSYGPKASLGPNGRPGYYPVTTTVTDYVTVSQCWNGVWETATFWEVRPICGCEADKPKPTYIYKTKYQPATKCMSAGCADKTDTIIYPYCEACEAQTECVVPTPTGCNSCEASTITVACSTTPNVPVVTSTISNSATITYAPPTSAVSTPAATPAGTTTTSSLPVFMSGAGAVAVKGSVVALAVAVAAVFF